MIFWKKKLIGCCRCHKRYSFDDNLFYHLKEYILICPNCNLMHKVDIQLLGKEYDKLKKIDKLNLTAIDVGSGATDRVASIGGNWTYIDYNNPANATGMLTSFQVWVAISMASCYAVVFREISSTYFTAIAASGNFGTVTVGLKTFSVNLPVQAGDYLGIYFTDNGDRIGYTSEGYDGIYYKAGNQTACVNTQFTFLAGDAISIYATGATPGWPHKWNGVTIGKFNGAVISKWNGVA